MSEYLDTPRLRGCFSEICIGTGRVAILILVPFQYKKMGVLERLADIKFEMSRTQKNKATEYHLGQLKARIAQLEAKLIEEANHQNGSTQTSFEVQKLGQARVALVGFPSTGKSSLLCKLTNSKSEIAAYEFTTLTCIPGQIMINGASI